MPREQEDHGSPTVAIFPILSPSPDLYFNAYEMCGCEGCGAETAVLKLFVDAVPWTLHVAGALCHSKKARK